MDFTNVRGGKSMGINQCENAELNLNIKIC